MHKRSLLLAALVLVLGLAACGGGDGGEKSSATGTTAAPGPPQQPGRGGEASIEEFGTEASGAQREEIEATFSDYLSALAERDYASACPHLAAAVKQGLAQLTGSGECPAALPALLAPGAAQVAREQADGEITGIRVEEESAFVVFRAPGAERYSMVLVDEGGGWRVGNVAASVLVPEL